MSEQPSSMQVVTLSPQALAKDEASIALINASQAVAGARCIHMDFELDAAALAAQDAAVNYWVVRERTGAQHDSAPLAVLGAEIDLELRRGWLRGPFVTQPATSLAAAEPAWRAVLTGPGATVQRWDAFIETRHDVALAWYAAQGFQPVRKHKNYIVRREDARYRAVAEVAALPANDDGLIDAVTELAARSFPGGYLQRDDFAAPESDEAVNLVLLDGNALRGYIRVVYEPGASEAFIENLAVIESARRRGSGRLLLNAALHWAFDQRQAPQVGLTVKEGNSNAEQLYQSAGFHLLAEGQHLRLERPDAAA